MTVLFRCRVEKPLLEKANRVTTRLGTSTAEMFRIFVAQIAHTGKVPLNLALLRAFPSALSIHAGRANRQTGERREQMSSSRFPSVLLLPSSDSSLSPRWRAGAAGWT